jgi:hypothetical protein
MLLDRMPVFLVGRDYPRENVLVRPVLAGAIVFWLTFLDADSADKAHAFKLFEADCAGSTCLRTRVVGFEPERGVENGFECGAIDIGGRGVTRRGAVQDPIRPEFATLLWSIANGEFAVKHFAVALLRALEHALLTDTAGADVKDERCDRVVRNHIIARRRGIGVVVHFGSPMVEAFAQMKRR